MYRALLTPSWVIGIGLCYVALILVAGAYWPDKSLATFILTLIASFVLYLLDRDIFNDGEATVLIALFGALGGLSFIYVEFTSSEVYRSIGDIPAVGISISVLYLAYKARFPKRQRQNVFAAAKNGASWTIYLEGDASGGTIYKKKITLDEAVDTLAELRAQGKPYMRAYSIIDGSEVYVELNTMLTIKDKSRILLPYRR
ncbi:MAG: hypothetical protein ACI88A_005338 [Paraglaciecola sp.]|jgi:hypothetical protein